LGYGWGGGVIFFSEGTTFRSEGNVITDNYAATGGSGVFVDDGAKGVMRNDFIVDNRCGDDGNPGVRVGALDESGKTGSEVELVNVTIAGNACREGTTGNALWVTGKGSSARLVNSILWGNGSSLHSQNGVISASYTLSEEAIKGEGNLSKDP